MLQHKQTGWSHGSMQEYVGEAKWCIRVCTYVCACMSKGVSVEVAQANKDVVSKKHELHPGVFGEV